MYTSNTSLRNPSCCIEEKLASLWTSLVTSRGLSAPSDQFGILSVLNPVPTRLCLSRSETGPGGDWLVLAHFTLLQHWGREPMKQSIFTQYNDTEAIPQEAQAQCAAAAGNWAPSAIFGEHNQKLI